MASPSESPAMGPNSGPTTIAPTMRMGESSTSPTAAMSAARTTNTRKLGVSTDSSRALASTVSHTAASVP
jgi:hypothetical protein